MPLAAPQAVDTGRQVGLIHTIAAENAARRTGYLD